MTPKQFHAVIYILLVALFCAVSAAVNYATAMSLNPSEMAAWFALYEVTKLRLTASKGGE